MPVPIAVTHAKGVGNAGAFSAQLETEGPFARLKRDGAATVAAPSSGSELSKDVPTATSQAAPGQVNASAVAAPDQPAQPLQPCAAAQSESAVETHDLSFQYPGIDGRPLPGAPLVVQHMSVRLKPGSRCLLIGPNGAGKTSLLRILAGKHKVPESVVSVLGQPPFYATELTTSGAVAYIGGNWERDVAFAGYAVPLQGGFSASEMINNVQGIAPERRQRLMKVLDIDPDWQMNKVSDGQRRRVQICMGLLRPFKVLLLDEVTVDLDVLGRSDLMNFLKSECEQAGATIIYATHIFDGLESWPTHLMYVAGGQLKEFGPAKDFPELEQGQLLSLVVRWLREEKAERKQRTSQVSQPGDAKLADMPTWNNGWAPGRLTSSLQHSSNTVIRM